jgi:CrcB protein
MAEADLNAPGRVAVPLGLKPAAAALVMLGGGLGAAGRDAIGQALPAASHGFPEGTLMVNLAGAFILGVLLEALVRSGEDVGWRRRARLLGGTGFCGGFTTYSTLAVETLQLARHGVWSTAVLYVVVSVLGGLLAAVAGILVGAVHARWSTAWLPVDPDVDQVERQP